jgi:hypothetical protein
MSVWEDVTNVAHLVMDHKTSDAHHGSTALVELGRALLGLPRVGLLVPSEVDEAVAEVAGELLSFGEVLALNGQWGLLLNGVVLYRPWWIQSCFAILGQIPVKRLTE